MEKKRSSSTLKGPIPSAKPEKKNNKEKKYGGEVYGVGPKEKGNRLLCATEHRESYCSLSPVLRLYVQCATKTETLLEGIATAQ